jgi:predicted GNAT family acetyltransferase
MEEHRFNNNKEIQNFELHVDGQRSFIEYEMEDDRVYLSHTEVPEEQSGKGIAAELVEKTFEYLESHNLKVVPGCSYVQTYLTRHPDWNRLLSEQ